MEERENENNYHPLSHSMLKATKSRKSCLVSLSSKKLLLCFPKICFLFYFYYLKKGLINVQWSMRKERESFR